MLLRDSMPVCACVWALQHCMHDACVWVCVLHGCVGQRGIIINDIISIITSIDINLIISIITVIIITITTTHIIIIRITITIIIIIIIIIIIAVSISILQVVRLEHTHFKSLWCERACAHLTE